eukprot:Rhum_TRINITY_DN15125_c7_g1::Rhum_TRINITY_DN15125_c7_g1_i1::g.138173::m.138173
MSLKALRSGLSSQRRTCVGPWQWATHTEKEKEKWGRQVKLPEDMPQMAHSFYNRKPGPSGKPWANLEDEEAWVTEWKEWLAKTKAEGRVLLRGDAKPVESKPFHLPETHEKFLEELKTMSVEDKVLAGYTVNEERAQPFHITLGPAHYKRKVAHVQLGKGQRGEQQTYAIEDGQRAFCDKDGMEVFYTVKEADKCYATPPLDVMAVLKQALADTHARHSEARGIKPEEQPKVEA